MAQIDFIGNVPVVIDVVHHHIHAGRSFLSTIVRTIADNGISRAIIDVPSACAPHVNLGISVEGRSLLTFYSVSSYSNAASVAAINRNLFSPVTPDARIFSGGSIEVASSTILSRLAGAGRKNSGEGGVIGGFFEIILKPGIYALDVLNLSGDVGFIGVDIDWYESDKA